MVQYQEKALLQQRERLTGSIFRLSLRAESIAGAARPGQFVMLRVGDGYDPLLRRPFSLHQATADGTIQILFKVVGRGTARLARLEPGAVIDCVGPLGHWFPEPRQGVSVLVGGGMGIAPLAFLARRLVRAGREPSADTVLLGGRCREEIALLADEFFDLGYRVKTATDDGSLGHYGLVTDLLDPVMAACDQVFTCGPGPMMRIVAKRALAADIDCWLSLETHMACGLGACLGCALPAPAGGYVHVCQHGPVFRAGEVAWGC